MKNLINLILSLIYKEECCFCGCSKENKILCKKCAKSVEILSGFAHSKILDVEIYSACVYDGVIKQLIHSLKFNHKPSAAKVLAEILSSFYKKILDYKTSSGINDIWFQNAVVVPVPTNKKKIKQRGYNNVSKIAEIFARNENLRFKDDVLLKIKENNPQYKTLAKDRKDNVKGVFKVNSKRLNFKNVIIVDDIVTTGSTLEEAIKTFKEAGVENIVCITVSKTLLK